MNYILSELMKTRRTFLRKLVLFTPLVLFILPGVMLKEYFIIDSFNWWYILILPFYTALSASLYNSYEGGKLKYKAVFSMPSDLKKVWTAKITVLTLFILISTLIHLSGVIIGKNLLFGITDPYRNEVRIIAGSLCIFLGTIWQIPLCLYLAKRTGTAFTIIFNGIIGIAVNLITVTGKFWYLNPFSWASRSAVKILHILPNGLPAEDGNMIVMNTSMTGILVSLLFSLLLFALITGVTSFLFSEEVPR